MNTQLLEILQLLRREVWEKRRLFASIYLFTSMAVLYVGWNWPKVYSSSSTILVDQQNILQPLMQGTAVTTEVQDRARLASEIIFSRSAMREVVNNSGWLSEEDISQLEVERIIAGIESRTWVENAGKNLIKISYSDSDAERAFETATAITDIFIDYSIKAKQKESQDAFEFINGQVLDYHEKLQAAEEALKEFQSANVDARPESQAEVNTRITELRRRLESTQLDIRELKIKRETLEKQLSGEAAITENLTREGQLRERLAVYEEQLSTLRLSYHDSYPDIVSLKTQIATIEETLLAESEGRSDDSVLAGTEVTRAATTSLLYQQLRSQFSDTETQLASLNARLSETQELLEKEEQRMIRINDVEAKLAELNRDYDVNQETYQTLLRQRENARISMNIDKENQGRTFKVQEAPALQLTPKGIRFAHFLAAGLVGSFILPIGLIYGLTLVDQRVRSNKVITENLGLPVLASVYQPNTKTGLNLNTFKKSLIFLVVILSWSVYGYAAWLRINGLSFSLNLGLG